MRLIDADALGREMYHKSFEVDDGRNVWNSGLWIRYKIFEEAIRDAPIIDAMPVKHGKWVEKHHAYSEEESIEEWQSCRCSECGRYDTRPYMYYFDEPNYCSYCGAKMDERKEE